jgi:hypothetical protein
LSESLIIKMKDEVSYVLKPVKHITKNWMPR